MASNFSSYSSSHQHPRQYNPHNGYLRQNGPLNVPAVPVHMQPPANVHMAPRSQSVSSLQLHPRSQSYNDISVGHLPRSQSYAQLTSVPIQRPGTPNFSPHNTPNSVTGSRVSASPPSANSTTPNSANQRPSPNTPSRYRARSRSQSFNAISPGIGALSAAQPDARVLVAPDLSQSGRMARPVLPAVEVTPAVKHYRERSTNSSSSSSELSVDSDSLNTLTSISSGTSVRSTSSSWTDDEATRLSKSGKRDSVKRINADPEQLRTEHAAHSAVKDVAIDEVDDEYKTNAASKTPPVSPLNMHSTDDKIASSAPRPFPQAETSDAASIDATREKDLPMITTAPALQERPHPVPPAHTVPIALKSNAAQQRLSEPEGPKQRSSAALVSPVEKAVPPPEKAVQGNQAPRPKRATSAAPPRLVLPSDLRPRSYYAPSSLDVPLAGQPASRPESAGAALVRSPRISQPPTSPRSPSSKSFMQRQYAHQARPATMSMPPVSSDYSKSLTSAASSLSEPEPTNMNARNQRESYAPRTEQVRDLPRAATPPLSFTSRPATLPAVKKPEPQNAYPLPTEPITSRRVVSDTSNGAKQVRKSRSFGSRLKDIFGKDKDKQKSSGLARDDEDAKSMMSVKSTQSAISMRSAFSFTGKFRRRKSVDSFSVITPEPDKSSLAFASTARRASAPSSPMPKMRVSSSPEERVVVSDQSPSSHGRPLDNPSTRNSVVEASHVLPVPSVDHNSIDHVDGEVSPNLSAGDIFPGALKAENIETILSSVERTGSFERKPSTSRRSKEEKVPHAKEVKGKEANISKPKLNSAMRQPRAARVRHRSGATHHPSVKFASQILVYDTFSPDAYDRTPEPMTCDLLREPGVVKQIREELNALKLSMTVHPDSRGNSQFFL